MIKKKELKKVVGLTKEEFDEFVSSKQIVVQPARLIPTLKTGDCKSSLDFDSGFCILKI